MRRDSSASNARLLASALPGVGSGDRPPFFGRPVVGENSAVLGVLGFAADALAGGGVFCIALGGTGPAVWSSPWGTMMGTWP